MVPVEGLAFRRWSGRGWLRMPAISAQVWWSSSSSMAVMALGRGLRGFPRRGLGHREGEGAVLAAGQADVRGDGVAGPGDGDVGEQQPGDALAFPHRGGGVVPDAGQVGDQLGDPGLLGVGELPGVLLAGLVVGVLGVGRGRAGRCSSRLRGCRRRAGWRGRRRGSGGGPGRRGSGRARRGRRAARRPRLPGAGVRLRPARAASTASGVRVSMSSCADGAGPGCAPGIRVQALPPVFDAVAVAGVGGQSAGRRGGGSGRSSAARSGRR